MIVHLGSTSPWDASVARARYKCFCHGIRRRELVNSLAESKHPSRLTPALSALPVTETRWWGSGEGPPEWGFEIRGFNTTYLQGGFGLDVSSAERLGRCALGLLLSWLWGWMGIGQGHAAARQGR